MEEKLKKAIILMSEGREEGFNAIYSETYNRVYFRAKQLMKNEEDAQDLVQIVFVEAYRNIATLETPEALYKWLDGITYRQGMKIFRKKKEVLLSEDAEGMFDILESNDVDFIPELTVEQKATSEIIRGIIEELPELQKTAIVMYYFDNMKVEQIADIMECSVGTIKSRLNYARKYIKDKIEEKEKKEGYRLHAVGLPVFWFSIKLLAENTTLANHTAQSIYNRICTKIGIQAAAIVGSSGSVVNATWSGGATAQAVAGVTKTTGIITRFASLSTAMKTIVVVSSVAFVGTGAVGAVNYAMHQNENRVVVESVEDSVAEDTFSLETDTVQETLDEDIIETGEVSTEEEEFEETSYIAESEADMEESNETYRIMAKQSADLLQTAKSQYGLAFSEYYYIYDVNKDDLQELIYQIGNSEADYRYVIYGFDGTDMVQNGETETIRTCELFGLIDEEGFLARSRVYGFETVWDCDLAGSTMVFNKECELLETEDGYEYLGGYEMPSNAYYLNTFYGLDEESIYQNFIRMRDADVQKEVMNLSIEAQHQISSFIGALNNYSVDMYSLYMAEPESLMWFVHYYLNDCGEYSMLANGDDMPFDWKNFNIHKDEFDFFYETGWGIAIPENYTYTAAEEYDPSMGYGMRITDNGWESIVDGSLMTVQGGSVSIVGNENGLYKLRGTFRTGAIDAPDEIEEKTFTASAVYTGDERIYDGLTIKEFQVEY